MNVVGFYLLLLALFILPSILNVNILVQKISAINMEYTKINGGSMHCACRGCIDYITKNVILYHHPSAI